MMSYFCAASETISSETPAFLQAMFSSVSEVSASRLRVSIVVTYKLQIKYVFVLFYGAKISHF